MQPITRPRHRPVRSHGPSTALSNRLVIIEKTAEELRPAPRRLRRTGKAQRKQLGDNIERFGCVVPVLITPTNEIIDGHVIWEVCKDLGVMVPTIVVSGRSDAEIRTLRISLNRIAELSSWDDEALRDELVALLDLDADLSFFTGFSLAEIDALIDTAGALNDDESLEGTGSPILGKEGDIWDLPGGHTLSQGNARQASSYRQLIGTDLINALVSDIPYGCAIAGYASKSHPNFVDGANLSKAELEELIRAFFTNATPFLADGALSYTFMDGQGLGTLMNAATSVGHQQIDLCVWDKVNPGMGSFYRQQAEYVLVTKHDRAPHLNNIALGKNGRNRSTVWAYPGLAGFGPSRAASLAMHPTVKPIGLIAEILLDCTRRGGNVLDPFAGSGTILLAAQRTKRRAFAMEIDPKYIDVAIRRIEQETGHKATHRATGTTYAETMRQRAEVAADASASPP